MRPSRVQLRKRTIAKSSLKCINVITIQGVTLSTPLSTFPPFWNCRLVLAGKRRGWLNDMTHSKYGGIPLKEHPPNTVTGFSHEFCYPNVELIQCFVRLNRDWQRLIPSTVNFLGLPWHARSLAKLTSIHGHWLSEDFPFSRSCVILWSIFKIIHISTAGVDESEEWSSQ